MTPKSPEALEGPALACVSPVTVVAVISSLKTAREVTCDVAPALAWTPLVAETLVVTEVADTIEPSAGSANAPSNDTASSGATRMRVPTAAWPGTITLIAQARAVAPAERSAAPSDAPSRTTTEHAAARAGMIGKRRTSRLIMGRAS